MDINIRGSLPSVAAGATIQYFDVSDELVYRSENRINSLGSSKISVDGQDIPYTIEQTIEFDKCPYASNDRAVDLSPAFSKISKITAQYQERETALRIGMINKVVRDTPINRCTDGSATCGANSICIPDPINDSYSVSLSILKCSRNWILITMCGSFINSVNAEMDSHYSKVKRPKFALTLMNAAIQISAMKMPIAITNWAAIRAVVEMDLMEMVLFANPFPIVPIYKRKLNKRNGQSHRPMQK